MKNIFSRGDFAVYRKTSLNDAMEDIGTLHHEYASKKVTIFISHKHDDLEDLKGVIGFLERNYNVKVYIDSQDSSMPQITSGDTAERIKEKIEKCERFILLATEGAIESKWCNWELGYGDAKKYKTKCIALFPMKERGMSDSMYKGNEYMEIYPYIVSRGGSDTYSSGKKIPDGYYVRYKTENGYELISLKKWLSE